MYVKTLIVFVPSLTGIYLGFTSASLPRFLAMNSLVSLSLGTIVGVGLAVAMRCRAAEPDSLTKKDLIAILTMPVLHALVFSSLFGLMAWGLSRFF